jgi:uncharacterized membrane protein SpoIIM required for sporulation
MSAIVREEQVLVNASRFRAEHAAMWERLDFLLNRIERRSLRALHDNDLLALPLLYRSALSSLSVARETSLDRALITYLEQLCTRAYFQIYGVPTSGGRQIADFFVRGWPLAVQALWREIAVALMLTVLGALVGGLLVLHDPAWFYSMIPDALAGGRDPAADANALRRTLYGQHDKMLTVFAVSLFTHNSQIAIFAFALGFAFAIPTVLLIFYNGLMLGAFLAVFGSKGLGMAFCGWLIIHGSTEIFAICLAGAAGFRIGLATIFPGAWSRADAAVTAGQLAARVMGGAVVMLLVAGLLEGIGRQTVTSDGARYAIGLIMLGGWLVYFCLPRNRDALALRP